MTPLMLLHTGRQTGKTTQAMAWVSQGRRTDGYPGWTRVLVVSHARHWDWLRTEYWARLEDFDHRVYRADDWANAHGVRPDTKVCVDDLEWLLGRMPVGVPGRLAAATITALEWEPQTFREKPLEPELLEKRVALPQREEGQW